MDQTNNIINLIKNKKYFEAKIICQKAIDDIPNSEIFLSLMGNIFLLERNYQEAKNFFLRGLVVNSENYKLFISLGIANERLNENEEAAKNFLNAINIKPDLFEGLNNLGFIYNKLKKYDLAIKYLTKCIEVKKDYPEANYNLGFAYYNVKDYNNAKLYLEQSLKLKHKAKDTNFYLGEIAKFNKNYQEALKYYVISDHSKTQIRILEMLAITNQNDKYLKTIENIIKNDDCDRRVASITPHILQEYKLKNVYPFCPNPLDFVLKFNLIRENKIDLSFISNLISEIKKQEFSWEIPMRTTVKGFTSRGNLSLLNLKNFKHLENVLLECMFKYKENYKNQNYTFVTSWPNQLKFHSWSNSLKKEGYNISHIHPSGWVSGVVYLKVPKDIKKDEAGIEFSLYGDDFVKNKIPTLTKILKPEVGDLIMFPSSLYHKTIPFNSNEERMCVAFDLMPA